MAKTGFSSFLENGKSFLQTNFLAVGSSLRHLSVKSFQIGPTVLTLKLDKGMVLAGGVATTPMDLFTFYYNHENDIQS